MKQTVFAEAAKKLKTRLMAQEKLGDMAHTQNTR